MDYKRYQIDGAQWLIAKRAALLADEMRVGKTGTVVAALDMIHAWPVLVLCPTTALYTWEYHFDKLSIMGPSVQVISKSNDQIKDVDVVIAPYSLLTRGLDAQLSARNWQTIVLDEAHYLKNPDAQRTRAVFGAKKAPGIAQKVGRLWALTGTPITKSHADLWPLLRVAGVYKKSYATFIREFCTGYRDGYRFVITGSKNADTLRELLTPIMLRRKRSDIMDDAPIRVEHMLVDAAPVEQPEGFDLVRAEHAMNTMLNTAATPDRIASAIISNSALTSLRALTGLAKVPAVVELIKARLDDGVEKVVVFAVHRDVIRALTAALATAGISVTLVWGATSAIDRRNAVQEFTENENTRVFIGNIQAAGEAIDLSVANEIIAAELSYTLKDNLQAFARCSGPRQSRGVCVTVVSLRDSYDARVNEIYADRLETFNSLMDT